MRRRRRRVEGLRDRRGGLPRRVVTQRHRHGVLVTLGAGAVGQHELTVALDRELPDAVRLARLVGAVIDDELAVRRVDHERARVGTGNVERRREVPHEAPVRVAGCLVDPAALHVVDRRGAQRGLLGLLRRERHRLLAVGARRGRVGPVHVEVRRRLDGVRAVRTVGVRQADRRGRGCRRSAVAPVDDRVLERRAVGLRRAERVHRHGTIFLPRRHVQPVTAVRRRRRLRGALDHQPDLGAALHAGSEVRLELGLELGEVPLDLERDLLHHVRLGEALDPRLEVDDRLPTHLVDVEVDPRSRPLVAEEGLEGASLRDRPLDLRHVRERRDAVRAGDVHARDAGLAATNLDPSGRRLARPAEVHVGIGVPAVAGVDRAVVVLAVRPDAVARSHEPALLRLGEVDGPSLDEGAPPLDGVDLLGLAEDQDARVRGSGLAAVLDRGRRLVGGLGRTRCRLGRARRGVGLSRTRRHDGECPNGKHQRHERHDESLHRLVSFPLDPKVNVHRQRLWVTLGWDTTWQRQHRLSAQCCAS